MKTRVLTAALVFAMCVGPVAISAQSPPAESLEQTYGRLCGSGQQSETCTLLRQGLTAKLAGAPSATQTSSAPSITVAPVWGFWAQMAGTTWLADNGNLISYAWQKPGQILGVEVIDANETRNNVLTLSPDGASLILKVGSDVYGFQPEADGSFTQAGSDGRRSKFTLSGDQLTVTTEGFVDGRWTATQATANTRRRLAASEIEGHRAVLARRQAAIQAGVWGFYSSLVGSKVLVTGKTVRMDAMRSLEGTSGRAVGEYNWLESNRVLATRSRMIGGTIPSDVHFTYDSARGSIEQRDPAASAGTLWKIEADGSLLWVIAAGVEARTTVVDDSTLRMTTLTEGSGLTAASRSETILHFTRITDAEAQALVPTARETEIALSYEKLLAANAAMEREREVGAAAAANRKKRRGGLLRAAIGAGLGVAAANASGMDATQTLGAAAKGVALMNPESQAAQVIGASGDAVLQSSGLGTTPAGTSAGSGTKASYPTKPNVLSGQAACSMMNESNYRQVGVSGGNDVQLKTMCAQAYEYYTMYKRAIAQGYSEADANRTFAAHQQAAQNAISFYANNRAQ